MLVVRASVASSFFMTAIAAPSIAQVLAVPYAAGLAVCITLEWMKK
jgi:hypothetical protein